MTTWAHSSADGGGPPDGWQELGEHLKKVAELARSFAEVFGAGTWGHHAGLFHDLGKAIQAFQRKLLTNSSTRVDHSTYGALVVGSLGPLAPLLSYVIAGHHAGLPDGGPASGQLHDRLRKKEEDDSPCEHGMALPSDPLPPPELSPQYHLFFTLSFFTRMIFSCLVDADYLDTERHMDSERSEKRTPYAPLSELKGRLDRKLDTICAGAAPTTVNTLRRGVLDNCRSAALLEPGFFSLTVPTGGAKTLSSMAFSLDHALRWNKRRVIYAIPFTSIIEQNAAVFRDALGPQNVLEHHCNYREADPYKDPEKAQFEERRALAAENWDAPVVVTTNVQFLESLFANRTSRCRKLHNIAGSVIVLDEAQAIPFDFLDPCFCALRELVANYGCTVVLCTATQIPHDDEKQKVRRPKAIALWNGSTERFWTSTSGSKGEKSGTNQWRKCKRSWMNTFATTTTKGLSKVLI